jgi:cytochrome P450
LAGLRRIRDGPPFEMDTREYESDGNGKLYVLPKRTCIVINSVSIHHNPRWWIPNYDEDNPAHKNMDMEKIHFEFWIDENSGRFSKKRNSDLLFTFGTGKRDCVGQTLAMKELIIVFMIFMKYQVCGPDGHSDFEIQQKNVGVVEPKSLDFTLKIR